MGATLMLWASFKPSRGGSAGAVAPRRSRCSSPCLLCRWSAAALQSPSLFGLYSNPLFMGMGSCDLHAVQRACTLVCRYPGRSAATSGGRGARSNGKVLGEPGLAFVLAAWALAASGVLDSAHSLIGFMVQGLVFSRPCLPRRRCSSGWRAHWSALPCGREQSAPRPRHAPPVSESGVRAAREPACGVHRGARRIAGRQRVRSHSSFARSGRRLRVWNCATSRHPDRCVLVTCFVAIPFVLAKTLRSDKDYRWRGMPRFARSRCCRPCCRPRFGWNLPKKRALAARRHRSGHA